MLDQILGHRLRVTVYFGGLAVGLSLLSAGIEAGRLRLVGPLDPTAFAGYAAVALLAGVGLAFVAAYLNESLVAGWLVGAVPAAGRYGGAFLQGAAVDPAVWAIGTAGVGLAVGGVGYGLASEKHRRDAGSGSLPGGTPRVTSASLAGASIGIGIACLLSLSIV